MCNEYLLLSSTLAHTLWILVPFLESTLWLNNTSTQLSFSFVSSAFLLYHAVTFALSHVKKYIHIVLYDSRTSNINPTNPESGPQLYLYFQISSQSSIAQFRPFRFLEHVLSIPGWSKNFLNSPLNCPLLSVTLICEKGWIFTHLWLYKVREQLFLFFLHSNIMICISRR